MQKLKSHNYKGHKIRSCAYTDSKRWYIVTYFDGTPWEEHYCQQFYTLAEARFHIDEEGSRI